MKKFLFKSKPFGMLGLGLTIGFVGGIAKITKESFADNILLIGVIVELIGVVIFIKWYIKARKLEKNAQNQ